MYLCTAPLSRFYYPETRRFINAFYYYYYYYWPKTRSGWQTSRRYLTMAWSRNLRYLPRLSQADVDLRADNDAKIPRSKQQRGYSNWIEGYVHDVEGKYCISSIVYWRCDKQNYQNLYYRSTAAGKFTQIWECIRPVGP